MHIFIKSLAFNKNIIDLDISNNIIGSISVKELGKLLNINKSIRIIAMCN